MSSLALASTVDVFVATYIFDAQRQSWLDRMPEPDRDDDLLVEVPVQVVEELSEVLSIAERQAYKLLELCGVTEAPVAERIIAELPRIHVERISPFPFSGATHWVSGRWVVVLNGAEPAVRQRFSLAHELKHIIDNPFIDVLYSGIRNEADRHDWTEQVCNYFAGCLLMPRPWLKKAWTTQTQSVPELARRFNVSQAAMIANISARPASPHPPLAASVHPKTGRFEPSVPAVEPPTTACQHPS